MTVEVIYAPGDRFRRTRVNGVAPRKWRAIGYIGTVEIVDEGFQGNFPGVIDTEGHWHSFDAIERLNEGA